MTWGLRFRFWVCLIGICATSPAWAADLLIANVTLIDGTGAPAVKGAWVSVKDGRIDRISRAPIRVSGAEKIDGKVKFLIPGLIDIHVHLKGGGAWGDKPAPDIEKGLKGLRAYLDNGVTTIFDAGNNPEFIYGLRAQERAGEIVSPRIFATGQVFGASSLRGRGQDPNALPDWPEIEARLERVIVMKPDVQKFSFERFGANTGEVIPLIPLDAMARIVAYVRAKNVRTTIHITDEVIASTVVTAGMSTLEHPVVTAPISDALAKRILDGKVAFATTFSIFDDTEGMGWPAWTKPMIAIAQANVKNLVEHGGIAALGSDHFDAAMVHHEIMRIGQMGLPPTTTLRIATLNGAIFIGREKEFGSLERGKWADMVLLDADPLADLANLKRIHAVYKAGQRIQ